MSIFHKAISLINNIYNYTQFKIKKIECHANLSNLNGILTIKGTSNLYIGNSVRINSGMRYNAIGGDDTCIFVTQGAGKIFIDDGAAISNSTFFSRDDIYIGKNVMIGGGVKIYDTNFHSLNATDRLSKQDDIRATKSAGVKIEKNAFIGAHSIILKGVIIGEGAIVGAGSVVTKNIPSGEVWGGNPANFIRKI